MKFHFETIACFGGKIAWPPGLLDRKNEKAKSFFRPNFNFVYIDHLDFFDLLFEEEEEETIVIFGFPGQERAPAGA